jgi:phosphoesterase RecJ-like protein
MIENQLRSSTESEVVAELRRRPAFVMVSHVKPDGDTLGAGLALGLALKRMGKRVAYFNQDARFRPIFRRIRSTSLAT